MSYFELLCSRRYFDIFLKHYNSRYGKKTSSSPYTAMTIPQRSGKEKEPRYSSLIKRYYMISGNIASVSSFTSNHVSALISNQTYIGNAYNSLNTEFRMNRRLSKTVSYEEFWNSIQNHKVVIVRLTNYRMDSIVPGAIPEGLLNDLRQLFYGLSVVPLYKPRKLVAVSKTLHFLLPNLVMPVDVAGVLRFLRMGDVPQKIDKQFDLFIEVFRKYIELAAKLGLKMDNGDGHWWNISVPKRIDNAIGGFWDIFNDADMGKIICGNIDTLLSFLEIH